VLTARPAEFEAIAASNDLDQSGDPASHVWSTTLAAATSPVSVGAQINPRPHVSVWSTVSLAA
jgi:hypothetical protein